MIDEPTRGLNLLDLLIVKNKEYILNSKVCDPFDNLDHCPVFGTLDCCVKKPSNYKRVIRVYNDENLNKLQCNLRNIPWHNLFSYEMDCNELVNIYTNVLHDEIETCMPSKEIIIGPRDKPGMTSHVKKLFRRCHRYHKIAQRSRNESDIENHRLARKTAKAAWKQAKNKYANKLFNRMANPEQRQKAYWKLMNSVSCTKHTSIPTLIVDGRSYASGVDKFEILNKFFVEQTILNCETEPVLPPLEVKCDDALSNIVVSEMEVVQVLHSLNTSKASGPDDHDELVLKSNAEQLAYPIVYIVNRSLSSGVFPTEWKQAHVTPVFKKGNRQDYRNYRPIFLLSCTSKVLERVVYNNLYEHCVKNNLLSNREILILRKMMGQ